MINSNHKNIYKDYIKRKCFLKKEIKFLILKSIFQNRSSVAYVRMYSRVFTALSKKKYFLSFQKKKCVFSGQSKGIFKKFEISRHVVKSFNNMGLIQNITTKK
jgi:hypothetical protein